MAYCLLYQEVRDFMTATALLHYVLQARRHAESTVGLSYKCTAMHADISVRQGVFEELIWMDP